MTAFQSRFAPLPEFATPALGSVTFPWGFQACGIHAGIKRRRRDLGLLVSDHPAVSAAFFTGNRAAAAPVTVTREESATGALRAVVVNSGIANACSGPQDIDDARRMRDLAAALLDLPPGEVAVSSTGVIGEPLPMEIVEQGIERAVVKLTSEGGEDFAAAIRTTDSSDKTAALSFDARGGEIRLGFAAKGAGMIAPNMATTLCFVTCDAPVPLGLWRAMMTSAVEESFNRITVDGQESTNDMVLGIANGAAGIVLGDCDLEQLSEALHAGLLSMALAVVADGEGATTTVCLCIEGAVDSAEAERVARAIADSPLVKTAIYGRDANWGRIVQAAGMGLSRNIHGPLACDVAFDGIEVARRCHPVHLDETEELQLMEAVAAPELRIMVDLHRGRGSAVVYFSDLTNHYVHLNAGVRT